MTNTSPFREGRHRLSVAHLLTALAVLFIVMPVVDRVPYGDVVETAAFTLVLLAAVNAVGGQRRTQITAAALAAPAVVIHWLHHIWPDLLPVEIRLLADAVFVVFVIAHLFRFVIVAPEVNAEVLCAAVSIFLLFAVAWSFLYTMLARWDPNAFTFTDSTDAKPTLAGFLALYFSVQVITTITFGDILPLSNVARMMTIVEATAGVFYMAILISRLVGLYAIKPQSDSRD
jgi:Ion channel